MNNDLISREALKKKLQARHDNGEEDFDKGYNIGLETAIDLIDNAPTVEYPFYAEAYQTGFVEAKEKIIHSIAKQYSEHNELVPIWLSIGDIKGGAE